MERRQMSHFREDPLGALCEFTLYTIVFLLLVGFWCGFLALIGWGIASLV